MTKKSIFKDPNFSLDAELIKARFEELKKQEEQENIIYKENLQKEAKRLEDLCCPLCKSKDKYRNIVSDSNGIMGSGYRSHTLLDHFICNSCGIHYSDIDKEEIKKPNKRLFS